jgi:5-methylcytosine-specific restriction endonuclease McrA
MSRTCEQCGSAFKPCRRSSRQVAAGHIQRFCSNSCSQGNRHAEVRAKPPASVERMVQTFKCAECGSDFPSLHKRNLCSHACELAVIRRKAKAKRRVLFGRCARCSASFSTTNRRQKFCTTVCGEREAKAGGVNHRKRARRAGVFYEPVNRLAVFDRDCWKCQVCGCSAPRRLLGKCSDGAPELDHRIPFALGGEHSYRNCQLACRKCNSLKGGHSIRGQMPLFCMTARQGMKV